MDVFGYDHSAAECIMRKSAEVPHYMYVGTVWAETNSRDDNRQNSVGVKDHRYENVKIARWMINAIKRRIQNLTQEGVLVTPNWESVTGYHESRAMPTISESDFQLTFPSAGNTLPLRADFLSQMQEKIKNADLMTEWEKHIKAHNEVFNQSGVAWQGETAIQANEADAGVGQARPKRKLESVDETLENLKKKKCCIVPHKPSGGSLIIAPNGRVLFQAAEGKDAVLSPHGPPLCLIYGNFKIGEEAQKVIDEGKDETMSVGFPSDETKAFIRATSDDEGNSVTTSLRDYLSKLESENKDITTLEIACHKLKPSVKKDDAGDVVSRTYSVETSPCVFTSLATPRKMGSTKPPGFEDVGSYIKKLPKGELEMMQRWVVSSSEQGWQMNPEKPAVIVKDDVLIEGGKMAELVADA